jgi:hypothetical protein
MYRGSAMSALGEAEEGYALIMRGLSIFRAIGAVNSMAFALILLALACGKLGRTTEGLNYLAEAQQIIETANDSYHEAELHRVRGDLLSDIGDLTSALSAAINRPSQYQNVRLPKYSSFEPQPASPASGAIRASGTRLASFSLRSTDGSPKASTHSI